MRLLPVSGLVLATTVAAACGSTSNDNNGSASGTQASTSTKTSVATSTTTSTSTSTGTSGSASGSASGSTSGSTSGSPTSSASATATATSTSTSTQSSTTDGGATPAGASGSLHVAGNQILDGNGNVVILRGVAVSDIGLLYSQNGDSISGVTGRIDEILGPAGLAAKAVRLPVYPRTVVNSGSPTYSPVPYPVGTVAPNDAGGGEMSAANYIANILKPAVDYVTSKNMYAIVDFHQIDNVTSGTSSADAVTFWTTVAPVFASYPNVIYEAFNEPVDNKANAGVTTDGAWTPAFTTAAQSWVTAIRMGAPNNVIIVGSPQWSQYPDGAIAANLTGGNLVYTAHIYADNWPTTKNTFLTRVTNAAMSVPVAVTEWGYQIGSTTGLGGSGLSTPDDTWAQGLQSFLNSGGESWTAWVADPYWAPAMFTPPTGTGGVNGFNGLTDFGKFVQAWLADGGAGGTSTSSTDGGAEQ